MAIVNCFITVEKTSNMMEHAEKPSKVTNTMESLMSGKCKE